MGFSFEIAPFIKAEGGSSRVTNFMFHPGLMLRFKHGFTYITRIAFETAGRYGITPVFNKVIYRRQRVSYFIAVSAPVRFGNDKPASVAGAFQFGINF